MCVCLLCVWQTRTGQSQVSISHLSSRPNSAAISHTQSVRSQVNGES